MKNLPPPLPRARFLDFGRDRDWRALEIFNNPAERRKSRGNELPTTTTTTVAVVFILFRQQRLRSA